MSTIMKSFRLATITLLIAFSLPVWAEAPRRIISLKPSITDTVYALGLGERLVGVTKYCDAPDGAKKPEIAADYTRPYTERIIGLRPDIVIGSEENSSQRSIDALRRAGLSVELFPFTTLGETLDSIEKISALLGAPERGKRLRGEIEGRLDALKKRYGDKKPAGAVVVWGLKPTILAGPGTFMDEAIAYIGLTNAAKGTSVRYPKIGLEQLIAFDPDIIIDLSMDIKPGSAQERPWSNVNSIKAVREDRVVAMDPGMFRAGPRMPNALEKLAARIYGN